MARGGSRRDLIPDFDPDCGDAALTRARQDIVIGRWQGLRELLRATGPDWPSRGHRVRSLAQACAANSTAESWLAAQIPKILASPAFTSGGVLFLTYDEGSLQTDHIPMVVASQMFGRPARATFSIAMSSPAKARAANSAMSSWR